MSSKSQFPWDTLKAECLRTICTQLMQSTGAHYSEVRRREDMIVFLNDVEKRGLDKAAQTLQEDMKTGGKVQAQRTTSPTKRKAEATEEQPTAEEGDGEGADGYNTRYKGVKRVKVRAATPERTRAPRSKQTASASAPTAGGAESASAGPPAKRGRGRPRKSLPADDVSANTTAKTAEPASEAEGDKQPVSTGKRGRGRPRKSDVPANNGNDNANAIAKTAASASETEGDKQPVSTGKRGRGRPRKSDAAPVAPAPAPAPAATSAAASSGETSAKRPRGRPRKHPLPAAGTSGAPTSKGKQVFEGVFMEKRIAPVKRGAPAAERVGEADEVFDGVFMEKRITPVRRGAPAAEHVGEADEGYEEDAAEEDENDDPVLLNGHLDDGTSSLGGSNKENEPAFAEYTPDRDNQDADAAGEFDPNAEEAVITETVETVDITQSTVIMPTIPMALAAAASNLAAADSAQASRGNSIPQDRPVLHPL